MQTSATHSSANSPATTVVRTESSTRPQVSDPMPIHSDKTPSFGEMLKGDVPGEGGHNNSSGSGDAVVGNTVAPFNTDGESVVSIIFIVSTSVLIFITVDW